MKQDTPQLVARLSSRVFLGSPLCRNEEWLQISKDYTVDSFMAAAILRLVPGLIRPVAYWFLPVCRRLRHEVAVSRRLIEPEVRKRIDAVNLAKKDGKRPPNTADSIDWMYEVSRGRSVDYVAGQLSLTMAAIHTTTETTVQALLDVCEHPEILQPLRDEIVQVVRESGWSKTSLYKMKLLDSFLKESQRMNPMSSSVSCIPCLTCRLESG